VFLGGRYRLTVEAASTYAQAAAVVNIEMHSPIIAVAGDTPTIHVRQPTDTRKGLMWRDVGLGAWLFEIDDTTGEHIAARLLDIQRAPEQARTAVAKALTYVTACGARITKAIPRHRCKC
jgi:hypothetical protein